MQTGAWLFPGKSGCFNDLASLFQCIHVSSFPLCWTLGLCLAEHAPPAWPKSRSSIKYGREKKKNREGGPNLQSDVLSKLLVGVVVTPPAPGKKLSLAVSLGFIGKIIKTFSFLNIWQRLLHKPRGHFCPYRFRQRKESLKGKTKQNPIDFLHGYWKGSWKNLSCEREGHQEVLPGPRQVTQLFVSFTDISVSEQYEITNLPTCCRSQSEEFHHA